MSAQDKKNIVIGMRPAEVKASVCDPIVWSSGNFAEDWYTDLLHEARTGGDHNSRRREILFAACFAESYMFEWARKLVGVNEIDNYFPRKPERYQRVVRRWKDVLQKLQDAGKIIIAPKIEWDQVGRLYAFRNELIHARVSRPTNRSMRQEDKPLLTKDILRELKQGWAASVAYELAVSLHEAAGKPQPQFLERPCS